MTMLLAEEQSNRPGFLQGIGEIESNYDVFVLDLWGVVHDGVTPFEGIHECLEILQKKNKTVCFLSNSPGRSEYVRNMLAGMGIGDNLYNYLLTSGEAVKLFLQQRKNVPEFSSATHYYDMCLDPLDKTVEGLGLSCTRDIGKADFLFGAYLDSDEKNDLSFFEEELAEAVKRKIPFICANPDRHVYMEDRKLLCPGSLAERYEELGGKVYWFGKPLGKIYEALFDICGRPDKSRMIAFGDGMETDIKGANNFGIDCVLNLIGLHREEVGNAQNPGEIDLFKLDDLLRQYDTQPDFFMSGVEW